MRPLKYNTVVPCAMVALLMGSLSACADADAAAAAPDYTVATRTVKFGDLDLTRSAGAATLYSRIQNAARTVCEPSIATRETILRTQRCKEESIARAVGDVNAPALTSYYLAKTHQGITLANQP